MATLGVFDSIYQRTYTVGSGGVTAGKPVEMDGTAAEAGEAIMGIAMHDADAGDTDSVLVIGECSLISGAAIAAGAAIEVGSSGKVITNDTGVKIGRALEAAGGADATIKCYINAM